MSGPYTRLAVLMELFLLIAIGITAISFISIVLTEPSPSSSEELIPEPAQAELLSEEEAKAREISTQKEGEFSDIEEQEVTEEQLLATFA